MVCVKGVAGLTGTLGKANSHFDPIHTGSYTTKLRQLLIDAEHSSSQVKLFSVQFVSNVLLDYCPGIINT